MKNLKYIFIFILMGAIVPSCVEDTAPEDAFGESPNLVSFVSSSANFSAVTDDQEYTKSINMRVKGPSVKSFDSPITATLSVDPSSTAIEGTHYRMDSNTITFSPENDYLGVFDVVMLTEGIEAPLPANPVLVLRVENVSGEDNVIANGKTITVNFNYLCYSDLSGTYSVTIDHSRCNSAPYDANFPITVTIEANPDGSWALSSADGGFLGSCTGNAGFDNPGNIVVVCGVVQESDDLEYGELGIGNITGGTWDEETGTLILNHAQTYTGNWPASYNSTYVRQ